MNLLETGLEYELFNLNNFWEYTIGEIKLQFDCYERRYKKEVKQQIEHNYSLALNIAQFTILLLNGEGSKIPSIQKMYPDLYHDEVKEELKTEMYKEMFKCFADKHNKQFNKRRANGGNI